MGTSVFAPSVRSYRSAFDGGLVLRDGVSGRIWWLEGEVAELCSRLGDAEAAAALSTLLDRPDEPMVLVGQPWQPPASQDAFFDRCLSDGGAVLRVRVWNEKLAGVLRSMLAPVVVDAPPGTVVDMFVTGGRTAIARDGRIVQDGLGVEWWLLVRLLARALRPDRAWLGVLHAATVVPRGGGAVAIAGLSGAGKTTLAGATIAAGACLLSDDATPIEAGSRLAWPLPLAMGVKRGSWPVFAALFEEFSRVEPVRFGNAAICYFPAPRVVRDEGRPVAAILFPKWVAGAPLQAERLRPRETLRLLAGSGTIPSEQEEHLADLLGWIETVPAWRLSYGDLDEAVSFVQAIAAGRQPETA